MRIYVHISISDKLHTVALHCECCYYCTAGVHLYVNHMLHFPMHSARLPTSTVLGEFHQQLFRASLPLHLLLPRELQPLPEVHPVLLSGAHCVPSVGSQQLLQWVQCGVHHPQPDEVCELPVHCHCTHPQPEGKPRCRGSHSNV